MRKTAALVRVPAAHRGSARPGGRVAPMSLSLAAPIFTGEGHGTGRLDVGAPTSATPGPGAAWRWPCWRSFWGVLGVHAPPPGTNRDAPTTRIARARCPAALGSAGDQRRDHAGRCLRRGGPARPRGPDGLRGERGECAPRPVQLTRRQVSAALKRLKAVELVVRSHQQRTARGASWTSDPGKVPRAEVRLMPTAPAPRGAGRRGRHFRVRCANPITISMNNTERTYG